MLGIFLLTSIGVLVVVLLLVIVQNKLVRRRTVLPEQLKDMFGEANMALARCNYDEVVNKCMTIIQQGQQRADHCFLLSLRSLKLICETLCLF